MEAESAKLRGTARNQCFSKGRRPARKAGSIGRGPGKEEKSFFGLASGAGSPTLYGVPGLGTIE